MTLYVKTPRIIQKAEPWGRGCMITLNCGHKVCITDKKPSDFITAEDGRDIIDMYDCPTFPCYHPRGGIK